MLVPLTGLCEERRVWRNWCAVERFADRAMADRNRHPVDIGLRIAGKAEAVRERVAEIEFLGAEQRRRLGLGTLRNPAGNLLRNVRLHGIIRPDPDRSV